MKEIAKFQHLHTSYAIYKSICY